MVESVNDSFIRLQRLMQEIKENVHNLDADDAFGGEHAFVQEENDLRDAVDRSIGSFTRIAYCMNDRLKKYKKNRMGGGKK